MTRDWADWTYGGHGVLFSEGGAKQAYVARQLISPNIFLPANSPGFGEATKAKDGKAMIGSVIMFEQDLPSYQTSMFASLKAKKYMWTR
jgi:hypothetical protein